MSTSTVSIAGETTELAATPSVRIAWSETAPVIDGRLDDTVWQDAARIDHFVQVNPVQGAVPTQRTEVRLLTDGRTLFLGIRCDDDSVSDLIADRIGRDEFLLDGDAVSFIFDTFHDRRHGYYFEVNARGGRRDVLIEDGDFDVNWDAIWRTSTTIDSKGWTVEVAIPFSSLNYAPKSDVWGFNIARAIRGLREEVRWADPARNRFIANLEHAGRLEGMSGISQGLGLEIVPTLALRRIDDREEDRHQFDVQPSGDIFYKLLPSLTGVLTINTDFGEAEVDPRRVNLTRFNLYYPEQRRFFLQDELLFDFADLDGNGQPFYSRRIGLTPEGVPFPLIAGAKVTGRVGEHYKLGVMNVQADRHDGISAQNLTVARGAVNLSPSTTIGALFTHGSPEGGDSNTLAAFDLSYDTTTLAGNRSLSATAWYQQSFTQGTDGQESAFGGTLKYPNDRYNWLVRFMEIGENFNPALGFVNRSDIRQYEGRFRHRLRGIGHFRTLDTKLNGTFVTDTQNVLQSVEMIFVPLELTTPTRNSISALYTHFYERLDAPFEIHPGVVIPDGRYNFDQGAVHWSTGRSSALQASLFLDAGTYYTGTRVGASSRIKWRPSYRWLVELDYQYNHIDLREGKFSTQLVTLQVDYQFSTDLAWETTIQWDNQTDDLGLNSRLEWSLQDGRQIAFVFSQNLTTQGRLRVLSTQLLLKVFWTLRF
jgi:hypothetical protein